MAYKDGSGSRLSGRLRSGDLLHSGLALSVLLGFWCVSGLEVSTGKITVMEAMNGSTVLIPCTYSSCIGIQRLYFNWHYDDNGTMLKLCEGSIAAEGAEPRFSVYHERVEFVGNSKKSNISFLLYNITFADEGDYVCFARNFKEKNRNHSATFTLHVVDQVVEIDNTLTTIIVSVVGGVIGFLIIFMVVKALVVHFILKKDDKNKECLVGSSAGVDNTENGHTTAKGTEAKGTPKA
ncbi:sodium channel subunit beta-4-like [Gadus macrocephalus]|uniref:sodium channel subunit beta-4-like n=1 Tax=Gadus macrocephalus TaxID=80720 RepID=UPI0028CBA20B|nr:sodium channel subunit beta-4-like [Gadus macrocephalus]